MYIVTPEEEIEEILVDTYGADEEGAAWEVTFQDGVKVPFEATLLGVPVTVLGFRATRSNAIQCQVRRDDRDRWVGIESLDKIGLPKELFHLLSLYQLWGGGGD